jgi:DNA polymerase-3 subunit alpha
MEMLRIGAKNRLYKNGLTKFGKQPYHLDIAVGIEFRRDHELLFIAIAKNNDGFERLNRFLSYHNKEAAPFSERAPEMENVFIIYPFGKIEPEKLKQNEYIGVRRLELNQFSFSPSRDEFIDKFVILHPVTFLPPEKKGSKLTYKDHNIHRLLRSVACNTLLSKLAEHEQADKEEFMLPEAEIKKQFGHFPKLIRNTENLLEQCSIECAPHEDKNKKFFLNDKQQDITYLREETAKGYMKRFGLDRKIWNERVEKELSIIEYKNFTAYYLITYDLIRYAKEKGFDFVGRGSGANSTVAYCLGITNVDPIELDLYFERFLNEERTSPPDFDIDFSWDNRDAVYAYLFEKYGQEHVCLLGTHVTYQGKSILREL